jgi:hypothetical protein
MEELENSSNYQLFRDCLSIPLISKSTGGQQKLSRKARGNGRRRNAIKPVIREEGETEDAEELADFIDVGTDIRLSKIMDRS